MNRKWYLVIITVMILMVFTACKSKEEEASPSSEQTEQSTETENPDDSEEVRYMKDLNASDYVTLGTYKGIEVALDKPEITDEDVEDYIDDMLTNNPISIPVTDRSVELGDTVNIDYEGKFDGVAFEGGTARGSDLTIGSGRFIDGFEDGCIGMEIGETRDIETVFPEVYNPNPAYAGKTAIFTVTVNSIYIKEKPELTDEYVQSLGLAGCSDVESYKDYIYDMMLEEQKDYYDSQKSNFAYEAIVAECEFKDAPSGMIERMNTTLTENLTNYANMYGVDIGTYVAVVYGEDAERYEEVLLEQSTMMAQHYLMMQAIADKEGMQVSDEELEEQLAREAAEYGYATADDYRELIDLEAYREYLLTQKVLDFIVENAVFVS